VRDTARRLGVSKNTAFAWRHKLLSRLVHLDKCAQVSGVVELGRVLFMTSYKGSRNIRAEAGREPRHTRLPSPRILAPPSDRTWAVFAVDRRGGAISAVVRGDGGPDLSETLAPRIAQASFVCVGSQPRLVALGKELGLRIVSNRKGDPGQSRGHQPISSSIHHTRTVAAFAHCFWGWMKRFCGVATKYLINYTAWFSVVVRSAWTDQTAAASAMLLEAAQARFESGSGPTESWDRV
jgi:hypothetical protein